METQENIIKVENYYMKVNIQMEKEMEMEKNIMNMVI